MSSTLPVIKVRTSQENVQKIKSIAKCNGRSTSKEVELLIKRYVEEFKEDFYYEN